MDLTHHCSQWLRIWLDNGDWIQLAQGFGKKARVCVPAGTSHWFCACCRETLRLGLINLHPIVGPPSDLVQCPSRYSPRTSSAPPCFFRPLLFLVGCAEEQGANHFWAAGCLKGQGESCLAGKKLVSLAFVLQSFGTCLQQRIS